MMSKTLELAIDLIQRPSITPKDEGCQDLIAQRLSESGFHIQSLPFGEGDDQVQNLWVTHSSSSNSSEPVLCFVGHTDVVPTGNLAQWDSPPFEPTIKNEYLYGRGSADMKGSVASMVVAMEAFVKEHPDHKGTIALLLTSDEEGPSVYGVRAVVEHFKKINQKITWAIVGEPTSQLTLGDTLKNGRRGSLGGTLTIHGKQGHIAYPHLANNPISSCLPALNELTQHVWDQGSHHFPATQFQISNIHSGTGATNVIPGDLKLSFNLRFSPKLTPEGIQTTIESILKKHGLTYSLTWNLSGLPFFTDENKPLVQAAINVLKDEGIKTELSTSGGTSDGRFVVTLGAEVIELGPVNQTIHQINECVKISDLDQLTTIYQKLLQKLLT